MPGIPGGVRFVRPEDRWAHDEKAASCVLAAHTAPPSVPGYPPMPHLHESHEPSPPIQELIDEVVVRFDAYARARAARDSLFPTVRATPRGEQQAFDALQAAVVRLRNRLG
ncbi:hypothetical protein ABZ759_07650 [Streptomyces sp. NPDC047860]|uniref:hypothetical protein n=1 Tax=Streptomyces sp. NPDC047860 TaxID=3155743 RepID=UPI0033F5F2B8